MLWRFHPNHESANVVNCTLLDMQYLSIASRVSLMNVADTSFKLAGGMFICPVRIMLLLKPGEFSCYVLLVSNTMLFI